MSTATKILIGLGIVVVLLIVSIAGSYNGLVTKREVVETQWSQIDTQLQRRNDLIPNLVETVKRYAKQEEDIFTDIADARARLAGAGSVEEQAEADAALGGALSRLLAISENYPDLKSNQNFIQLQDELAGTENRIATVRRDYNEAARVYNTTIRRFPTVLYANILGFEKVDYFEASDEARKVPNVGGQFGN